MAREYSIKVCKELEEEFRRAELYRPMHVGRYEVGTELVYDVTGLVEGNKARVRMVIEKFVGGGFAGQVYRVKILAIDSGPLPIAGLEVDKVYAIKILIPPAAFSKIFRNALYWAGFQGPFQLQVNPFAARSGALWQKFIRRGAKIRFGDERVVVDIYATFVDENLGSCGELSEWIDGRTWQLEVDNHMDLLGKWIKGRRVDSKKLGSPEYRAKREFMHKFVDLLHEMGCPEFARQYEWSTCKSQPNCLKRITDDGSLFGGLVAVDFRAGLALLPFLPMSPGDFKLIAKGVMRGSLVQFDRGDIRKLEGFMNVNKTEFADMQRMFHELKESECEYRDSLPDITHNHIRLFYSSRLWSNILDNAVAGWKVENLVDERSRKRLQGNRAMTLLFFVIGIIPLVGRFFQRIWGRSDWRRHYLAMFSNWTYFRKSVKAKAAEILIGWHRTGRVDERHAINLSKNIWYFFYHLPFSILPVGVHRFLTDSKYAKDRLVYLFIRPVRLYFNAGLREQWLREMVKEGKKKNLLSNEDAEVILSQVNEPFIQKYLKSLAVHVCTLPVTQIVSVTLAIIYVMMHPEMPRGQAWGIGLGIIAFFQVVPVSPGSLVRGLYVVYLVIREKNFKDYNVAVFLGFFKYIGYLAFPIQMAYHYPALARFMAGHWATEAVHFVPVFGERGALLEHGIFSLFYNWPLTIRRRIKNRARIRERIRPRYWHIYLCVIVGTLIFGILDFSYIANFGRLPDLIKIWWIALILPVLLGAIVTLGSGGVSLGKRIIGAAICGGVIGLFSTAVFALLVHSASIGFGQITINGAWRVFAFTLLSTAGAMFTELKLPDPSIG